MDEDERRYEPHPAAKVIERERRAQRTSVRRAAQIAELSEGRWRQIAKGYQQAAQGVRVPVNAPPETLARMARALDVGEAALRAAGAHDVADVLADRRAADEGRGVILDLDRYEGAHRDLANWLTADDDRAHPPTSALWLWTPRQLAENLAAQVGALERAHGAADRAHFSSLLSRKRLPTDQEPPDDHPAPTKRAGGSPARDELDLAAMSGTPEHLPDTTTGEESQDSGTDEPA